MEKVKGLERRLQEITADFFRSKLGLPPQAVDVLWHDDLVLLRVRGFLTRAEEARASHPFGRVMLQAHYERVLDKLSPMLATVVQGACGRTLRERRLVLDLGRSECVYHLRLDPGVPLGGEDSTAAKGVG